MFFLSCVCYAFVRVFVLTSWLSFVVSNCEFVTFPLVSWVRCGTWLYWFLIFAPLLTLPSIFISFSQEFNKFNNTWARMLNSIYYMTLKLLKNSILGMKKSQFCHLFTTLKSMSLRCVTKSVIHLWFIDFVAWPYIIPRCDVVVIGH